MQIIDTKWAFHKAVINLNGKCFEVDVKSWKDYNDRAIQIIDNNGNVYYTSLNNVLLIGK